MSKKPKVVKAEKFVLTDSVGKVRAEFQYLQGIQISCGALTETESAREFLAFSGDPGTGSKSGCRYFRNSEIEL